MDKVRIYKRTCVGPEGKIIYANGWSWKHLCNDRSYIVGGHFYGFLSWAEALQDGLTHQEMCGKEE